MGSTFTPIADRMKVYEMVREAVRAGRFNGAKEFIIENKSCGYVLPHRQTISRWALGQSSPLSGKRLFVATPSEALSFFLGAWLGDGWADDNDGGKRLLLKVRSYDFAREFADCAAKILGKTDSYWVKRVVDKRGKWYLVKVTSLMLYEFVNGPLENLRDAIEPFPESFLRGLFTAEGNPSVSIQQERKPRLTFGLSITNSDVPLLNMTREMLVILGYQPGKLRIDRQKGEKTSISVATKSIWQFTLSKRIDVKRFAESIGFADSHKQRKLEDAIQLIDQIGSFEAASKWPTLYEKIRHRWISRQSRVPIAAS